MDPEPQSNGDDSTYQPSTLRLSVYKAPSKPDSAKPKPSQSSEPEAAPGASKAPKRIRIAKKASPSPQKKGPFYRSMLNSIYDAAVVVDGTGRILDANQRATEFYGWPVSAFRRMSILDIICGADRSLLKTIRENKDRFALIEAYCRTRQETEFPAEIAISRLSLGPKTAFLLLVRNTTVRRQAEEMLRTEHNALQNSLSGTVITDVTAQIEYANPAFARMLGRIDAANLTHQDLRSLFADRNGIGEAIRQVVEEQGAWRGELRVVGNGLSRRTISAAAAGNRNMDGELIGIVFSFADVTERKQAEETMRQANEDLERRVADRTAELAETNRRLVDAMRKREEAQRQEAALQSRLARAERMESLGVLAGGVAHDLNNILGPAVALPSLVAEGLRDGCSHCAEQRAALTEDVAMIEEATQRAARTIRDLLTLSRRGNFEKQPLCLNALLHRYTATQEFKALRAATPGIAFDLDLDASVPPIRGSESHIVRAVSNIVRNGFEAMGQGGTMTIRTLTVRRPAPLLGHELIPEGLYNIIRISDEGPGMPEEDLQRIFEPFFTRKRATGSSGSGLGLSIVHRVVKDHDGYIDVKSTAGSGTTFDLYFPCEDAGPSSPEEEAPLTDRGRHGHILVADDVTSQRRLAERALTALGYAVTSVSSGREVLRYFREMIDDGRTECELVLLDMVMDDGMDGLDTLRALREMFPDQKAIVTSGHGLTERASAACEMGAGWLPKPYTLADLSRTLRSVLDPVEA